MRIQVLLLCGLVLMICVIIICFSPAGDSHSRALKSNPTNDSREAVKIEPPSESPAASPETEAPGWQERFWAIASEPVWMQSQEELEALANGIPDDQIAAVLQAFGKNGTGADIVFCRQLVLRWAQKSPAEAAQWVATLPENAFGQAAFKAVVVPWEKSDLIAATEWVQKLPEGENKTTAELSLANEAAAQKQAATAVALLTDLPASPERDSLLNYSVRQWTAADPDQAISWINQVPNATLREQMLENVAVDMGRQDPVAAADFVATALSPGEGQNSAAVNVVRSWAASAPDQAANWVEQFPPGNLRDLAVANLVDVWEKDDPGAANTWAATLPK